MSFEYAKAKSAFKTVRPRGPQLQEVVLQTLKTVSDVVGATLGPGGSAVLIERQEHGLAPLVTKDGVTVFRHLGFQDSTQQVVLEAARDAAVRTANEAGDGTTTATVLSEAIVRNLFAFTNTNPRVSPQKIVRLLESTFRDVLEPAILASSRPATTRALQFAVAKVSANGDEALAEKVMECYDLVGDEGNVTITEMSGPSGYRVEKIIGYVVPMGYDECCVKFAPAFITNPGRQTVDLANPIFVVYHGQITEVQQLQPLMERIGEQWQVSGGRHNVVLVATGYGDSVIGELAYNFRNTTSINVFPLLAPMSPISNGQLAFLEDIAAITGAVLLDPISAPLETATLEDLGFGDGLKSFEASRFRSTIVGFVDEEEVFVRVDQLQAQLASAESILERTLLQERLGKLTGGIARLVVVGASNGELKEKRDRAEDAVCAVRGAIQHGCLPGGAWTFLMLVDILSGHFDTDGVLEKVLVPALIEPFTRLLTNCGLTAEETSTVAAKLVSALQENAGPLTYDCLANTYVNPYEVGILDSTPAVLEALRNALSIASLLGTLGGTIAFSRDTDLDRKEALTAAAWHRDANVNPANERQ